MSVAVSFAAAGLAAALAAVLLGGVVFAAVRKCDLRRVVQAGQGRAVAGRIFSAVKAVWAAREVRAADHPDNHRQPDRILSHADRG